MKTCNIHTAYIKNKVTFCQTGQESVNSTNSILVWYPHYLRFRNGYPYLFCRALLCIVEKEIDVEGRVLRAEPPWTVRKDIVVDSGADRGWCDIVVYLPLRK